MISLRPTFCLFLIHREENEASSNLVQTLENIFQQSCKFINSMNVMHVLIIIFVISYRESSESLSWKIEEMSNLQVGHSLFSFSHGSIQSLWRICRQGRRRT